MTTDQKDLIARAKMFAQHMEEEKKWMWAATMEALITEIKHLAGAGKDA